jgi:hypothetical protein
MEIVNILGIGYFVSVFIAAYVMLARSQAVIRRKVQARDGMPVSGIYALAYAGWAVLKTPVLPIVLVIWFVLGRPEPGRLVVQEN